MTPDDPPADGDGESSADDESTEEETETTDGFEWSDADPDGPTVKRDDAGEAFRDVDDAGPASVDDEGSQDATDEGSRGSDDEGSRDGDEERTGSVTGERTGDSDETRTGSGDAEPPGSGDAEPPGSGDAEPPGSGDEAGREDAPLGGLRDRVVEEEDGDGSRRQSGDREGPLGDVAAEIDERRARPTQADDELFEEMDVGEVDSDALWEQVEADETVDPSPQSREIRQIDKHKYCQRCPHFADPPTVKCTHEGTEILEQIDMETFEVADCPIILEDERLEKVTTD